jgi:hypothetical protein
MVVMLAANELQKGESHFCLAGLSKEIASALVIACLGLSVFLPRWSFL